MLWMKLKTCRQHTTLLRWWDILELLLLSIYVGAKSQTMFLMRKVGSVLNFAQLARDLTNC